MLRSICNSAALLLLVNTASASLYEEEGMGSQEGARSIESDSYFSPDLVKISQLIAALPLVDYDSMVYFSYDHEAWTPKDVPSHIAAKMHAWYRTAQESKDLQEKYALLVSAGCLGHRIAALEAGKLLATHDLAYIDQVSQLEPEVKDWKLSRLNQNLTTSKTSNSFFNELQVLAAQTPCHPDVSYREHKKYRSQLKALLKKYEGSFEDKDLVLIRCWIEDMLHQTSLDLDKIHKNSQVSACLKTILQPSPLAKLLNITTMPRQSSERLALVQNLSSQCLNYHVINELGYSLSSAQSADRVSILTQIRQNSLVATLLGDSQAVYDYLEASRLLDMNDHMGVFLMQYAHLHQ